MPQLNQLSDVILSQLFWLAITLGFIYFVIGKGMIPRILSTVDKRNMQVTADLEAAERAKAAADELEESYRLRMDASRSEVAKLTNGAKAESAQNLEKLIAKATVANQAKLDAAIERIAAARRSAQGEIASAAAEMTQEVVAKVAGMKVSKEDALKAIDLETLRG